MSAYERAYDKLLEVKKLLEDVIKRDWHGMHVHPCPECYEYKHCGHKCTLEDIDVGDGTPCGAHVVCRDCEKLHKTPRCAACGLEFTEIHQPPIHMECMREWNKVKAELSHNYNDLVVMFWASNRTREKAGL